MVGKVTPKLFGDTGKVVAIVNRFHLSATGHCTVKIAESAAAGEIKGPSFLGGLLNRYERVAA